MGEREDEVQVVPAEVLHLASGCGHPGLNELRLTDAPETLTEQGLDRLDPRSVRISSFTIVALFATIAPCHKASGERVLGEHDGEAEADAAPGIAHAPAEVACALFPWRASPTEMTERSIR